jgi:hypothetical protein
VIEQPEGYVLIYRPDHPYANKAGYVREHRLVMEGKLGRYLTPTEVVHHKPISEGGTGRRDDNREENLVLYAANADHLRAELTGRAPRGRQAGRRGPRASRQASESDAPASP